MKKIGMLLALTLFAGVSAFAAEGTSVAVIRIQDVLQKSEYAKIMETQIRAGFKNEEQEIEDLQKLIRSEQEKLQSDTLMSPESYTYKDKVMQIERLKLKLRDRVDNFTKQTRSKMSNFWRSVYADFQAAVARVAQTGRYDLIITAPDTKLSNEANQQDVPEAVMSEILQRRVQFISPKIDITQQVIDTMNAINRGRR